MSQPLKLIFEAQKTLIAKYVEKGKQEQWPISLEEKPGQAFMRELFGFLEEEIFEAYEVLEAMSIRLQTELPSAVGPKDVKAHIDSFNEEVADCLSFWVEIFMYIGFDEETIHEYYAVTMEKLDVLNYDAGPDTLQTAINYSKMILNLRYGMNYEGIKARSHNLIIHNRMIDENPDFNAGNYISPIAIDYAQNYLFHCIKHLNIARNCLKVKYWRESVHAPDYDKLHNQLMESWLNFMVFLYSSGFVNSTQLQISYMNKNQKNIERINTKW